MHPTERCVIAVTCVGLLAGCATVKQPSAAAKATAIPSTAAPPAASSPSRGAASATAPGAAGLHGLGVSPVPHKPPLVLQDTAGRSYDLLQETKGRLTYLYFGYTHCPDECPTTMADLAAALRAVGPAERQNVAVVFVTTDPKRDDGRQLRTWLNRFDSSFVGLTGSAGQIAQAERQAGVPLAVTESDGHGGYGVSHSTEVLAYSPDGLSHVVYASGFSPSDYAHDLPLLLARRP